MLLNKKCCPRNFARLVQIQHVHTISSKTKAFLKEKAIQNFKDLSLLSSFVIQGASKASIRHEIIELQNRILSWFEKEEVIVNYSKSISAPPRSPDQSDQMILLALLIYEPFFGNRRKITTTKRGHLPLLYSETEYRKKTNIKIMTSRRKTKRIFLKIAS